MLAASGGITQPVGPQHETAAPEGLDDLLQDAELAGTAERYTEMASFMKKYVERKYAAGAATSSASDKHERDLLSRGYKALTLESRHALSALAPLESARKQAFVTRIGGELRSTCTELIELLDKFVLPNETFGSEGKIFFLKLKGDCYRYIAELEPGSQEAKAAATQADAAYESAFEQATNGGLVPTHPVRLGVALNYAVFKYETLHDTVGACKLAKEAFDDALLVLDKLGEHDFKDSTLLMQLIRDNLTLWTGESD